MTTELQALRVKNDLLKRKIARCQINQARLAKKAREMAAENTAIKEYHEQMNTVCRFVLTLTNPKTPYEVSRQALKLFTIQHKCGDIGQVRKEICSILTESRNWKKRMQERLEAIKRSE